MKFFMKRKSKKILIILSVFIIAFLLCFAVSDFIKKHFLTFEYILPIENSFSIDANSGDVSTTTHLFNLEDVVDDMFSKTPEFKEFKGISNLEQIFKYDFFIKNNLKAYTNVTKEAIAEIPDKVYNFPVSKHLDDPDLKAILEHSFELRCGTEKSGNFLTIPFQEEFKRVFDDSPVLDIGRQIKYCEGWAIELKYVDKLKTEGGKIIVDVKGDILMRMTPSFSFNVLLFFFSFFLLFLFSIILSKFISSVLKIGDDLKKYISE